MIELVFNRLKCGLEVCKIHNPTEAIIDWTIHGNLNAKAVPVHAPALVPFRNIGQPVRSFDREFLEDLHRVLTVCQETCASADSGASVDAPCKIGQHAPCSQSGLAHPLAAGKNVETRALQ